MFGRLLNTEQLKSLEIKKIRFLVQRMSRELNHLLKCIWYNQCWNYVFLVLFSFYYLCLEESQRDSIIFFIFNEIVRSGKLPCYTSLRFQTSTSYSNLLFSVTLEQTEHGWIDMCSWFIYQLLWIFSSFCLFVMPSEWNLTCDVTRNSTQRISRLCPISKRYSR